MNRILKNCGVNFERRVLFNLNIVAFLNRIWYTDTVYLNSLCKRITCISIDSFLRKSKGIVNEISTVVYYMISEFI